jgi:integrase
LILPLPTYWRINMAINKIKPLTFKQLKATEKEQVIGDGGGLYVRVRSIAEGGGISFRFRYRFGDKQCWLNLESTKLVGARKERQKYADFLSEGLNPALERQLSLHRANQKQIEEQQHIAKLNARMDVNGLFELWAKTDLINRKDLPEIHRVFGKEVLPTIGACLVEDVKKGDIAIIIAKLKQRGVVHMARNLLKLLRQMFRFAVAYDLIESDPSASISIAKMTTTPTERDRILSEQEIKALAKQLPEAGLLKTTECAVWVCLSTMCRIGELSKAKLSDIDLDNGVWTIPKENSKNGKAHTIYLSKFALAQFNTLLSYTTHHTWVFPNRDGSSNVDEKSLTKQLVSRQTDTPLSNRSKDNQTLVLAGGKWTSHDLRRTGATMMGELGIAPDVIEKCLNHSEENKVKRIYQRQKLDAEQRHAWGVLGERLDLLVNTDTSSQTFSRICGQ